MEINSFHDSDGIQYRSAMYIYIQDTPEAHFL